MARANLLQKWFPGVKSPAVLSAPMLGVSNGTLAAQVSKAGGFGVLPAGFDVSPSSAQLTSLDAELTTARAVLGVAAGSVLPVGVGFINCHASTAAHFASTVPDLVVRRHRAAAVWLFAPDPDRDLRDDSTTATQLIRALKDAGGEVGYKVRVLVQVGTVAAAREAVRDGADAVIAQGVDAGGHQFARGSGVVALVPEVRDMLDGEFAGREVALVAAGGIADGRGVAAVLALGAEGVVLGTRFIVAKEALTPKWQRKLLLETTDGGVSTNKSSFHDDIQGTKLWPKFYDGRAVIADSYRDHVSGLSIEENRKKFNEARDAGEVSRMVSWAGTGIGLVREELPAAEITVQVREAALERILALQSYSS